MTNKLTAPLCAAWLGALSCVPAHAALTLTGVSCSGHSTGMTSLAGYLDCSGAWSGNNLNQSADVAAQILADWGLSGLASQDITGGNGRNTGTLSFAAQSGKFVISLKAGDAFSLYEFDGSTVSGGISSINFDTLGVGFFSGPNNKNEHFFQDLSHADLYTGPTTPVPEPGTYALLLAGLGVVGLLARQRRGLF